MAAAVRRTMASYWDTAVRPSSPGEGGSFAWHQDGTTHWNSPAWDQDIHGVNFMVQFYRCTAANSVWFVPGSHALGKVDIKKLVDEG